MTWTHVITRLRNLSKLPGNVLSKSPTLFIVRRSRQQTTSFIQHTTTTGRHHCLGIGSLERLIGTVLLGETDTNTKWDTNDGESDGSKLEGFLADHGCCRLFFSRWWFTNLELWAVLLVMLGRWCSRCWLAWPTLHNSFPALRVAGAPHSLWTNSNDFEGLRGQIYIQIWKYTSIFIPRGD